MKPLRQNNLKLSQKAILLTAVPLAFELLFIAVLVGNLKQLEKEYARESYAREVAMTINLTLQTMLEAAGAYEVYQRTGLDTAHSEFHQALADLKASSARLSEVVKDDKSDELYAFKGINAQVIDAWEQINKGNESRSELGRLRNALGLQQMLVKVNQASNRVIRRQLLDREQQRVAESRLREQLQSIILLGVGFNIALAAYLVWQFNRTTSQRLDVLMQNMVHLAMERPLQQRLQGADELARIDGVFHTMTEVLAEARHKEQALIENALSVICSLDASGKFTSINKAVETGWGYSQDELTGTPLSALIAESDRSVVSQALSKITPGQSSLSFEARLRRKDNLLIDLIWTAHWSQHENSWFCVAHDISDRKRVERMKQEVIAMVGHDLRGPLTALKATLTMFELGSMGQLTDKGKNHISKADALIDRLVLIINDLLDIDKFQSGAIELSCTHVPITELVGHAYDAVIGSAASREIQIVASDTDLTLFCDGPRIIRVLVNLLDNAIKFAPSRSTVTVSTKEARDFITISVQDRGPGIAHDQRELIFERFKQTNRSDETEKGGSGLGLAICKAIVEAHQGAIGVDSTEGEGSRFWIKMPNRSAT